MSYSFNISGHKDNPTDGDYEALKNAADAFAEAVTARGFNAAGQINHAGETHSISRAPNSSEPGPEATDTTPETPPAA